MQQFGIPSPHCFLNSLRNPHSAKLHFERILHIKFILFKIRKHMKLEKQQNILIQYLLVKADNTFQHPALILKVKVK